jgi:hypothetical protein
MTMGAMDPRGRGHELMKRKLALEIGPTGAGLSGIS